MLSLKIFFLRVRFERKKGMKALSDQAGVWLQRNSKLLPKINTNYTEPSAREVWVVFKTKPLRVPELWSNLIKQQEQLPGSEKGTGNTENKQQQPYSYGASGRQKTQIQPIKLLKIEQSILTYL